MNDNETTGFKMRIDADEDDADEEMQEEVADRQLSKLNQRVTLMSILLPCLYIVIIPAPSVFAAFIRLSGIDS